MKLLEFEVKSPFRNLKGLKIKFDSNMSTYVIIGTNGAGKSNVLEALSSVFKTLYYDSTRNFEFNFYLKYEMLNHNIWFCHNIFHHVSSVIIVVKIPVSMKVTIRSLVIFIRKS